MLKSKRILLLVSGSIASYKACTLISQLRRNDFTIKIYASKSVEKFVGLSSFEGLSGEPVLQDIFAPGHAMDHIDCTRWADLILLYPATANSINRLAAGIADDGIGTFFLANNFAKPFWLAPAMNHAMLAHPATQKSISQLQQWGCQFFFGEAGELACGEIGPGRLIEPEEMTQHLTDFLTIPRKQPEVEV